MFEQAFKNIDADLRNEAGCTTELDYTEQTSWLLFLKYLDGLEQDKAMEAELEGKKYAFSLDEYAYTPDDQVVEGEVEAGKRYEEPDFNKIIEILAREKKRVEIFG